jgi:hypothetical protein
MKKKKVIDLHEEEQPRQWLAQPASPKKRGDFVLKVLPEQGFKSAEVV